MEQLLALMDELDGQLAGATRLASNRAEHLRLAQISSTLGRLRAQLGTSSPAISPAIPPGDGATVVLLPSALQNVTQTAVV